jgi:hypothetical protein
MTETVAGSVNTVMLGISEVVKQLLTSQERLDFMALGP